MVAIIKTGNSIRGTFTYNEQKVKSDFAECIMAENYPMDVLQTTEKSRLHMLLDIASRNRYVTRNSVHISLNFAPGEQLQKERLQEISRKYMDLIGFGDQPYLVYRHHDAGHPHLHIVTVKIRPDGSRIETQNIGRNQSEKARKEIEKSFGLVPADDHKRKQAFELEPIPPQRVQYGRSETKRAIQNVLDHVINQYKHTSLPELNAVLKQYHVTADRGSENSRVYINKGLVYRILDEKGKKVGVPIKASAFYSKPTLKFLEKTFSSNEAKRIPHKARVKNAIDLALLGKNGLYLKGLVRELEKQGIATVLRENAEGLVYGITYVDHRTKCVFNGSALGKRYSAKAIQERCIEGSTEKQKITVQLMDKPALPDLVNKRDPALNPERISGQKQHQAHTPPLSDIGKTLDELMHPKQTSDYLPYQLRNNRRKKKRKHQSNNQ